MLLIVLVVVLVMVLFLWMLSLLGAFSQAQPYSGWLAFFACLTVAIIVLLFMSGTVVWR